MKRRDLLKTGMVAAGAAALALTGCNNKSDDSNKQLSKRGELNIVPKQTDVYKFSCPELVEG